MKATANFGSLSGEHRGAHTVRPTLSTKQANSLWSGIVARSPEEERTLETRLLMEKLGLLQEDSSQ
jgi:hypothetical protein